MCQFGEGRERFACKFLKKTSSKCCLHCSVSLSGQGIRGFTLGPAVLQHHEEGSVLIWYSERWANSLPTLLFVAGLLETQLDVAGGVSGFVRGVAASSWAFCMTASPPSWWPGFLAAVTARISTNQVS